MGRKIAKNTSVSKIPSILLHEWNGLYPYTFQFRLKPRRSEHRLKKIPCLLPQQSTTINRPPFFRSCKCRRAWSILQAKQPAIWLPRYHVRNLDSFDVVQKFFNVFMHFYEPVLKVGTFGKKTACLIRKYQTVHFCIRASVFSWCL